MNIAELEPRALWSNFLSICAIPHPSHFEKALSDWIVSRASGCGLEVKQDLYNNIIVRKPASPGMENRKGVVMQAHIDMVPQARTGSAHDFKKDPIRPRLNPADPRWLVATDTTLGADNGLGAAAMLCFMEDRTLVHGPLEFLFTINEEDGMSGARAISADALKGSYLLNLDGEEVDELTIGCAGTARTTALYRVPSTASPDVLRWCSVQVSGLLGGHSGMDVHRGRGHATMILCRLLDRAGAKPHLGYLCGGDAANAIPRDASATVGISPDEFQAWKARIEAELALIQKEYEQSDPAIVLSLKDCDGPHHCIPPEGANTLLALILSLPNGLMAMEPDLPGLTRTSSNLGITRLEEEAPGKYILSTLAMVRSSSDAEKEKVTKSIEDLLFHAGATTKRTAVSPAWSPEPDSPLLALAMATYKQLYGTTPKITSTHGALECGLFRPLYPKWDMISLGPTIRYPHSPDETTLVSSASIFWRFLVELVSKLG